MNIQDGGHDVLSRKSIRSQLPSG